MENQERPALVRLTLKKFPREERDWLEEEGLRRKHQGLPHTHTAIVLDALRFRRSQGGHNSADEAQQREQ